MPCRFLPPLALLAFACLTLPGAADPAPPLPRPSHLRSDLLYTHKSEFVQVSPMRTLTLNAHVEQFAYDPLGLEIAEAGSETSGNQSTHFVKTIDAHTGHEISRLMAQAGDAYGGFDLLGWSVSGKYVLLRRYQPNPQDAQTALEEYVRWDLSASPAVARVIQPEAELPPDAQVEPASSSGSLSPDSRWLLFREQFQVPGVDGKQVPGVDGKVGPIQTMLLLYDPEHGTFRTLTLPAGVTRSYGWSDARHLNVRQDGTLKHFDVVTGAVSPAAVQPAAASSAASKQYPDLTLDTEYREQEDKQPTGGHLGSYLLWIRRTPHLAVPLGAAVAGLMPSNRGTEIGPYDSENEPRAVWSPTGRQIAFIASGALCVTDIAAATGTFPRERLAVGLKLSCPEEQELAASSLKQIGLGIMQFTQDDDEKYPDAKGLIDTLQPYLQTTDVFELDGHQFVYEKPAASLRDLETPADTENGYMDLPCARVVLFCDGHVKVFPK